MVKPSTEPQGRCRFADVAAVRPFTGPATVYVAHCWAGRWGDLVAACCLGAQSDRVVWLDVFAVRQWPGNAADLDFRTVVARCTAVVAAIAPPSDAVSQYFMSEHDHAVFLSSPEFAQVREIVPFCRVWCIGEHTLT